MARSKKLQAKGRAILKAKSSIHPPDFNIMDYKMSMVRALNHYSANVDPKEKTKFAFQYWKTQGKNITPLKNLPDSWFSTIGAVAHMAISDIPLHEHDLIRLDNAYNQLVEIANANVVETESVSVVTKKTKSVQDYINDAASEMIGEIFEHSIDTLIKTGDILDVKTSLTSNQVKAPVAKKIAEWAKVKLNEFKTANDDKELTEAYGGKRVLNKIIGYMETVIADCGTIAQIAKTTRAPRKRKEKPASVLAAKMKYMREFIEFKLKSITPDKIVGSDQVWLYNTKLRKLFKYQALDGYTLTIKGTTVQNFDPEKSGSKILRKPEIQLNDINTMSKRPISNLFNEIKATMGRATGRVNEDYIIINAFL